ncbi:hypothetical protein BU24DRAFT_338313 [Aaosphaeria arxii CBS 175.79]|uniref:Xylanolytic transcriptional activator regulatory domain-containing protein n=1 Tax=Aaosphaeria arxii CBS 175.79 TaxID=1450172 RepID=A0A6A5Y9T1_9PLEO|nr:uncharacterized protein BU24DRAFT_338313 [Aaosphaeria arxii CBS 175.79]KAF2021570.1 hypothetical protein BU24DRAFT_338313 [Aaosphaeria arxii CBS 175.79]
MEVAAVRFNEDDSLTSKGELTSDQTEQIRSDVLLQVIDDSRLENVQALLILAYTELCDDRAQRACSLLRLVAKHIEELQINREGPKLHEHARAGKRLGSYSSYSSSSSWIDEEEERRVFWNAFMLDRLCAALTGNPPGLSGVSYEGRRLPACASFWYTNQSCSTPFLSIPDPSGAGLELPFTAKRSPNDGLSGNDATEREPPSTGIGSLAFYIETVESLSTVMTHFLQQPVDFNNKQDVSRWLSRWKLHLPQQWADSGMSRRVLPGIMDPAMTAANATHNTCLILLHEEVAYPDPRLRWVQLPSVCSADTCLNAAIEVCTIIDKLLQQRGTRYPISPQLGFCAFISGRTMLLYWRSFAGPIAPQFALLLQNLDDMHRRVQLRHRVDTLGPVSIFSRLSGRLRTIHARCESDPSYEIDRTEALYGRSSTRCEKPQRHWLPPDGLRVYLEQSRAGLNLTTPELIRSYPATLNSVPAPGAPIPGFGDTTEFQWNLADNPKDMSTGLNADSNISEISQSLMGDDFMNMDRIVSFDDMFNCASETSMDWGMG